MLNVLNLGCGQHPLRDTADVIYTNIDATKPKDGRGANFVKHDILKIPYPMPPESFDRIYLFHTIEHIPETAHKHLLTEIHRLLKKDGVFVISYPEFKKVAQNYIDNKAGKRDFWKACLYGRGLTKWDRHIALMDTEYFIKTLREVGLAPEKVAPERTQSFNTIVTCKKAEPMLSYETMLGKEFGGASESTDNP